MNWQERRTAGACRLISRLRERTPLSMNTGFSNSGGESVIKAG